MRVWNYSRSKDNKYMANYFSAEGQKNLQVDASKRGANGCCCKRKVFASLNYEISDSKFMGMKRTMLRKFLLQETRLESNKINHSSWNGHRYLWIIKKKKSTNPNSKGAANGNSVSTLLNLTRVWDTKFIIESLTVSCKLWRTASRNWIVFEIWEKRCTVASIRSKVVVSKQQSSH